MEPIYNQGKSFICCDLSSSANDIFVAWTVTGALGFALAALCGWRIVRHTFGRGRR